ncbi:hypothetical protein CUMW_118950, partial [Citrus unshiu]
QAFVEAKEQHQNLIFRFLQSKARIQIWLFEQKDLRIEGRIIGFDEYMNLVLDEAEEVSVKKKSRKPLGRILLKGDNITLMMNTYVNSFSFSLSPPLITRTNGCSPTEFSFRSSYLLHKLNFLLQIHSVLSCTNINTLISGENEVVLACVWVTVLLACDLGYRTACL